MGMGRTYSHARSQSLGTCSNNVGPTEWISKTVQNSREMKGRDEETSWILWTKTTGNRDDWKKCIKLKVVVQAHK